MRRRAPRGAFAAASAALPRGASGRARWPTAPCGTRRQPPPRLPRPRPARPPPRLRGAHAGPGGALVLVRGHHLREPPRHLQRLQRLRHRRIARHGDERVAAERPRGVVARRRQAPGIAGQHGEQRAQAAGFAERGRGPAEARGPSPTAFCSAGVRNAGRTTSCQGVLDDGPADVPPTQDPAPRAHRLGRRRGRPAPVALRLRAGSRGRAGAAALSAGGGAASCRTICSASTASRRPARRRARGVPPAARPPRRAPRAHRRRPRRWRPRVRVQRRDPQRRDRPAGTHSWKCRSPAASSRARQDDVVPPCATKASTGLSRRLLHRGRRLRVVRGRAQVAVRRGLPEVDGAVRFRFKAERERAGSGARARTAAARGTRGTPSASPPPSPPPRAARRASAG